MAEDPIPYFPVDRALASGLALTIERDIEYTCTYDLLVRFYQYIAPSGEDVSLPASTKYNPEHSNGLRYYRDIDVLVLVYYRGFYVVVIRKDGTMSGPHACRLYYASRQSGGKFWIATLQIDDAMFYNADRVIEQVTTAISNREFYIAPKSRKDPVPL